MGGSIGAHRDPRMGAAEDHMEVVVTHRGADLVKGPSFAKSIEAREQLLKIGIERSAQIARSKTARVKVAVPALLGAKRHVHVQRGNGHY